MRKSLFGTCPIPLFSYEVEDWVNKKSEIISWLDKTTFSRQEGANFYSDRPFTKYKKFYARDFVNLLNFELKEFVDDIGLPFVSMIDIWTVEYGKGDFHLPHTHRASGFSGILYVNFNKEEHPLTIVIQPWNGILDEKTKLVPIDAEEGTLTIMPSNLLHFTVPNESDYKKTIISFDISLVARTSQGSRETGFQ